MSHHTCSSSNDIDHTLYRPVYGFRQRSNLSMLSVEVVAFCGRVKMWSVPLLLNSDMVTKKIVDSQYRLVR